jgi:hypothetical protein
MPDHSKCAKWVKLIPESNEIPINKILLTWTGLALSPPQVFRNQEMADKYRDEMGVTAYLVIPNAKEI